MPHKDPERGKAWRRNYRQKNRARTSEVARVRHAAIRAEIRRYKTKLPCKDCRKKYPHYVMDFDHVRGKKAHSVSDMVSANRSLRAIWAEIAKCDLVCANCHRIRTHSGRDTQSTNRPAQKRQQRQQRQQQLKRRRGR